MRRIDCYTLSRSVSTVQQRRSSDQTLGSHVNNITWSSTPFAGLIASRDVSSWPSSSPTLFVSRTARDKCIRRIAGFRTYPYMIYITFFFFKFKLIIISINISHDQSCSNGIILRYIISVFAPGRECNLFVIKNINISELKSQI